ncbi:uncharacterized protein LOC127444587 [Myxocyprinus asiaticus]|uniref:uncharacterized protein LOC127444587 n=1 Tax=Myxocyprinus asiaticus TaxID=70543 RepID=UPI002222A5A7|nr:uncharacterized protein LOC127444587 [Myxocyprinus asiaticus]
MWPFQPHRISVWFPYIFHILLYVPLSAGLSIPVAVNLGDTAILTCNKTCDGVVLWRTDLGKLDVLKCGREACTEGDDFKNRASLSAEMIKHGSPSLTLRPALYNDEGWYEARCDSTFVCKVFLEVFVPNTVNASAGNNTTLSCYARTEKKIADNDVYILWKREDQIVLQVQNGITHHGSGFADRASISLNGYRNGDLSLNILGVTPSDKGLYRCYHKLQEEHGHPGAITLNIKDHQHFLHIKSGDNLTLDLFSTDPVTVFFNEIQVCTVKRANASCSPDYNDRVSVINYSLVLQGLTAADNGTFTVKNKMGEVISVNTVTVEGVTQIHYFIAMAVTAVFVLFCVCLLTKIYRYHRKTQAQQKAFHCCFNVAQSSVDLSPASLSEPECIGLPHQETCQNNISEQLDAAPRTPVEETTPFMPGITTEKQDNPVEARSTQPLLYEN